jgi:hypothetical protein
MCEKINDVNNILKLQDVYSKSFESYNTIIWQLPAALITGNILLINFLPAYFLFLIPIINFVFIYALFKFIHNQNAIRDALKEIQEKLRKDFGRMIPDFEEKNTDFLKWIVHFYFLGVFLV